MNRSFVSAAWVTIFVSISLVHGHFAKSAEQSPGSQNPIASSGEICNAGLEGQSLSPTEQIASQTASPSAAGKVPSAKAAATKSAKAGAAERSTQAKTSLGLLAKLAATGPEASALISSERFELMDLLRDDPNTNLAVRSPLMVMNAAQRMLALILNAGVETIRLPTTGETLPYYHFFSTGLETTGQRRIVGNESAINDLVNNLKQQARGDRSGSSIVLLVGSHGTGKSEFLKILAEGAESLTGGRDPRYAVYTYEWTGLGDFPGLLPYLTAVKSGDKTVYPNLPAPLGDSPFTLLPVEVQNLVLNEASPGARGMIDGMEPRPWREPDLVSKFIRDEMIRQYSQERGHVLSAQEIVEVLNKHVVVKRVVMNRGGGKMPLIDAQGNDLDIAGLFMTPNPVVRFASGAGPSHVMSWFYNGKLLQGHGGAISLDEYFRNPVELQNMLLGAFESRVLSIGGAPTVPFDAVIIAATNSANLTEVTGNAAGAASGDRFKIVPMRWSTDPHQVAQVLLLGKTTGELSQQPLQDDGSAPVEKAKIDDLFPRRQSISDFKTPDGRFRLWYNNGTNRISIAPHTLLTMAEIVAATRMETNPARAKEVNKGNIADSILFRDPISRLQLYEGRSPNVKSTVIKTLHSLGLALHEGESGISARDAAKWFSEAIDLAGSPQYRNTLTPGLAIRVFNDMIDKGSIRHSSTKEAATWLGLKSAVVAKLLIPRLEADISTAMANGDRVVTGGYLELVDEMIAIHQDPDAKVYTSQASRQERAIDFEKMSEIRRIYRERNGRDLSIDQIAVFTMSQLSAGSGVGLRPEPSLLEAVSQYYAKLNARATGVNALAEYSQTRAGGDEVKSAYNSLIEGMMLLGYDEVSAVDALLTVQQYNSARQQNP